MSWLSDQLRRTGRQLGIGDAEDNARDEYNARQAADAAASARRAAANGGLDPNLPLDDQYAWLTRTMYEDNVRRFQPLEDQANAFALPGATRDRNRRQLADEAIAGVNNSFDRADNRLETLRSRTGQAATARERESESLLSDLDRSAATVKARNDARTRSRSIEDGVLVGRAS